MEKLVFSTTVFPKRQVFATCSACGQEVVRVEYGHYEDYKRQRRKIERTTLKCPHCKAVFVELKGGPKWERTSEGDLIAKAENGDFLVWKYGYGYKWRYRTYGELQPKAILWARTVKEAKAACERHVEWR